MSFNNKEIGDPIAMVKKGDKVVDFIYLTDDDDSGSKTIKLKENDNREFESIPPFGKRESLYICGKSGSGKSTFAARRATLYHRMYPKNTIYLFSMIDEDPVFTPLEKQGFLTRVVIDDDMVDQPIEVLNEMKDCLAIFDDIDTHPNIKIQRAVNNIMIQVLQLGRKANISFYNCSHHMTQTGVNANLSRTVLLETDSLVIFNKYVSKCQAYYVLNKYFDLNKKKVKEIIKIKSRWTLIRKDIPMYYLTQKCGGIIEEDDD